MLFQISVITGSLKKCCTVDSLIGCSSNNNCQYPHGIDNKKKTVHGFVCPKKENNKHYVNVINKNKEVID